LIALACSTPPAGHARWSLRLLERQVALVADIPNMDHSTIGMGPAPRRAHLVPFTDALHGYPVPAGAIVPAQRSVVASPVRTIKSSTVRGTVGHTTVFLRKLKQHFQSIVTRGSRIGDR
jgi:hypothetical protein